MTLCNIANRSRHAWLPKRLGLLLLLFVALHLFCAAGTLGAQERGEDSLGRAAKSGSQSAKTSVRPTIEGPSSDLALGLQRRQGETFLKNRLGDEMRRLEEQKAQRDALLHASQLLPPPTVATAANPREGGDGAPTSALRKELETARQRLAELQVNDTDLHPDVIAAREKIATLQQELREAEATTVPPAPQRPKMRLDSQPDYESQLSQIDAMIRQQDEKIEDDKRQLAMLRVEKRKSASVAKTSALRQFSQAGSQAVPADPALRRPPLPISKGRRSATRIIVFSSLVFFTLLLFGVFIIARKRSSRAIHDGATLQEMLPTEVDYIGSIPRMKAG